MNELLSLVPGKPDAEVAADLRKRLIEAHQPVLKVLQEAHDSGFQVNVSMGLNGLGQMDLLQLTIAKVFK